MKIQLTVYNHEMIGELWISRKNKLVYEQCYEGFNQLNEPMRGMSKGTITLNLKEFEEDTMLQELVLTMDPFESSFFYPLNNAKRLKFFDFLWKHFKIDEGGQFQHLLLHISMIECDGYTQFEKCEKE